MSFLIASDNGPSPAYLRTVTGEPRARNVIITEFRDARVFPTSGEAAEAHRKWCEVLRDSNPDNDQWPTIVPVTHIPATPEFEAAIMLSSDNIPAEGAEVKLIWRNGKTHGVSRGFLRAEMLQGRLMHDPDFCRYFMINPQSS
jgi:hypothetical protein